VTTNFEHGPIREEDLRALEAAYAGSSAEEDIQTLVSEIRRLQEETVRLRRMAASENLAEFMRRSPLAEAVAAGEFELPGRSVDPEREPSF
jgi:hypothetical protein